MSDNSPYTYSALHLRFKLRVPPRVFLGHSRQAATIIASVEGLLWKIWLLQEEEFEMGGIYLFSNREAAESYLKHPIIQAVCSNPAVVSSHSQLWDVESSLSALTRAPLWGIWAEQSQLNALLAGVQ
jgi:Putative mono-oxygenase ydhR